jgi:hypothetical protein
MTQILLILGHFPFKPEKIIARVLKDFYSELLD